MISLTPPSPSWPLAQLTHLQPALKSPTEHSSSKSSLPNPALTEHSLMRPPPSPSPHRAQLLKVLPVNGIEAGKYHGLGGAESRKCDNGPGAGGGEGEGGTSADLDSLAVHIVP